MENVCGSERKVCVQCLWRVCVRVKGEHTEVCVSVRVQEKKSTQKKQLNAECVPPQAASEWEREREQGMREKKTFKP